MSKELKPLPCPFCGGVEGTDEQGDTYRWRRWACACGVKGPDVRCNISGSGHGGEAEARQLAIAEWNTRASIAPQPVAKKDELRGLILSMKGALGHPDNIAIADKALAMLAASPSAAAREPLTDEQIAELYERTCHDVVDDNEWPSLRLFVKAVREFGITKGGEQ